MENNGTIQAQSAAAGFKKCIRCHESKPLSEFHRKAASIDGHQSYCKQCMSRIGKERFARRMLNRADAADVLDGLVDGLGPEHTGTPMKRRTALSAYSTREFLSELKKRGFRGHLEWCPPAPKPKVVNLSDID